jgi:hypothetical protein
MLFTSGSWKSHSRSGYRNGAMNPPLAASTWIGVFQLHVQLKPVRVATAHTKTTSANAVTQNTVQDKSASSVINYPVSAFFFMSKSLSIFTSSNSPFSVEPRMAATQMVFSSTISTAFSGSIT